MHVPSRHGRHKKAEAKLKRAVASRLEEIFVEEDVSKHEIRKRAGIGQAGLYRLLASPGYEEEASRALAPFSMPALLKVAAALGYEVQIQIVKQDGGR